MNLMDLLEKSNSKASCVRIVDWVGSNPDRFGQLVDVLLDCAPKVQQRAAWPLSYCVEAHSALATRHLKRLVRNLRRADLHDAVIRSTVRSLQFTKIPKALQGEVAEVCFRYRSGSTLSPAIRIFSMSVLSNLTKELPELRRELTIVLEDQLPYASPGFVSRAKKLLRQSSMAGGTKSGNH